MNILSWKFLEYSVILLDIVSIIPTPLSLYWIQGNFHYILNQWRSGDGANDLEMRINRKTIEKELLGTYIFYDAGNHSNHINPLAELLLMY